MYVGRKEHQPPAIPRGCPRRLCRGSCGDLHAGLVRVNLRNSRLFRNHTRTYCGICVPVLHTSVAACGARHPQVAHWHCQLAAFCSRRPMYVGREEHQPPAIPCRCVLGVFAEAHVVTNTLVLFEFTLESSSPLPVRFGVLRPSFAVDVS